MKERLIRIIALVGVAFAAAFGVLMAVFWANGSPVVIAAASVCAAAAGAIWIFIYITRIRNQRLQDAIKSALPDENTAGDEQSGEEE